MLDLDLSSQQRETHFIENVETAVLIDDIAQAGADLNGSDLDRERHTSLNTNTSQQASVLSVCLSS